jgi:hypothetical protein
MHGNRLAGPNQIEKRNISLIDIGSMRFSVACVSNFGGSFIYSRRCFLASTLKSRGADLLEL